MNPKVKSRWLAALRSGEYKQVIGALRNGNGFCCLGVLTDLRQRELGETWRTNPDESELTSSEGYVCYLSPAIKEWSEIKSVGLTLSSMNDRGDTFDEIAAYIEENL